MLFRDVMTWGIEDLVLVKRALPDPAGNWHNPAGHTAAPLGNQI